MCNNVDCTAGYITINGDYYSGGLLPPPLRITDLFNLYGGNVPWAPLFKDAIMNTQCWEGYF